MGVGKVSESKVTCSSLTMPLVLLYVFFFFGGGGIGRLKVAKNSHPLDNFSCG